MRTLTVFALLIPTMIACGEESRTVASNCDATCQQVAQARDDLSCVFAPSLVEIDLAEPIDTVCMPDPVMPDSAGFVTCDVTLTPNEPVDLDQFCASNLAWARSPEGHVPGCIVRQLDREHRELTGWYFEEHPSDCPEGQGQVRFQAGALSADVTLSVVCLTPVVATGEVLSDPVDPAAPIAVLASACDFPDAPDARTVGQACLPHVIPEPTFDSRRTYVESHHLGCTNGVCITAGLDGDPSPECDPEGEPPCVDPASAADRSYCTCDCGEYGCECPTGYSCERVLPAFLSQSGMYCTKD